MDCDCINVVNRYAMQYKINRYCSSNHFFIMAMIFGVINNQGAKIFMANIVLKRKVNLY